MKFLIYITIVCVLISSILNFIMGNYGLGVCWLGIALMFVINN